MHRVDRPKELLVRLANLLVTTKRLLVAEALRRIGRQERQQPVDLFCVNCAEEGVDQLRAHVSPMMERYSSAVATSRPSSWAIVRAVSSISTLLLTMSSSSGLRQ